MVESWRKGGVSASAQPRRAAKSACKLDRPQPPGRCRWLDSGLLQGQGQWIRH